VAERGAAAQQRLTRNGDGLNQAADAATASRNIGGADHQHFATKECLSQRPLRFPVSFPVTKFAGDHRPVRRAGVDVGRGEKAVLCGRDPRGIDHP